MALSRLLSITVLLLIALPCFAQIPAPAVPVSMLGQYARDPRQPIDQAYTDSIRKYTTEPYFNTPLTDYLPASKSGVPTPATVLGDVAGAPGKLPYAEEVHAYFRELEKHTPRVKVFPSANPRKAAR